MTDQVLAPGGRVREDWRREALIAAAFGAIPVIGVLSWGWSPLALLLLFGLENVVIGLRQLAMMLLVARARPHEALTALGQAMFFTIHYFGFCAAHIFFSVLLVQLMGPDAPAASADGSYPVDPGSAFTDALATLSAVWFGVVAIVGWQIVQLAQFVGDGEGKTVSLRRLMGEPYGRIAVLHIVIIVGSGLVLSAGLPTQLFVVLALYKVAVDVGEIWWRARRKPPAKTWRDLPAPPRGVVFDATRARFTFHPFFVIASLFIVMGLLMLLSEESRGFAYLWLGFIGFILALSIFTLRANGRKLESAIVGDHFIEGRVDDLSIAPARGSESFTVKGVLFAYADNTITGGFNKTTLQKGPIREGLNVRIHYAQFPTGAGPPQNVIAKLEILP